jgi:hypothetical protein
MYPVCKWSIRFIFFANHASKILFGFWDDRSIVCRSVSVVTIPSSFRIASTCHINFRLCMISTGAIWRIVWLSNRLGSNVNVNDKNLIMRTLQLRTYAHYNSQNLAKGDYRLFEKLSLELSLERR